MLALGNQDKPLILQVGVPSLFKLGHIPGSKLVGSGSTPEGIQELMKALQGSPSDREVVLYCGCCPWGKCPNIRPAFRALQEKRLSNIKVLYLPDSFPKNWVAEGFPVEKSDGN